MFFFSYTAAIIGAICLVMAAVILTKKRDRLSWYLIISTAGVGLWNISNAFADLSWNEFTAHLWCGFALVGSMFFIVFYVIFLEQFSTQRPFKNRLIALFILLPAIFFSSISFSSIYITDIIFVGTTPAITIPGKINYLILVYSLAIIFYGLWRLRNCYKFLPPIKRKQILYIKAGFLVSLGAGIVFTIILPFLGNFMLFSLAAQFTIISIFLTVYTIYKHNFLDIKVIIQRSLIYTVLVAIIVSFYLAVLFIAQSIFFGSGQAIYLVSAIITCVVGIFSVSKIDDLLRRLTDRVFFKDRYDSAKVLQNLSETLNSNLNLNDLVLKTTAILENSLKIKEIYISLLPHEQEEVCQELKFLAEKYNLPLTLLLERQNKLIGVMFLGSKLSGDNYTDEDISLLKTFAHQMTLALEKSQLYEQVKDHSKNLEKKIEERTAELKNLQEKQSQELFEIAHELQTPLTVLKGELNALIINCPGKEKTEHLEKNIDRISNFINNLLKLARLDFVDGQKMEVLNLSHLLLGLVEEFIVIAQGSNIIFEHHIEENIFISGDKNKLGELISNLVGNAMKYIANERKVIINLQKIDSWARLEIIDTGAGISAEDLPNLFKRFYRGNKAQGNGTGLGLVICKKIVTLHNGEIKIKSQAGHGTIVEVLLPINQ